MFFGYLVGKASKSVTLERARGWSWDLVLATVQDNQKGFARFAQETGAKYAYHIGNTRQEVDWSLDPLALNASDSPMQGRGVNIAACRRLNTSSGDVQSWSATAGHIREQRILVAVE